VRFWHAYDDMQFKVRIGSTRSDLYDQEMGVPRGSILSVTVFDLKIKVYLINYIKPGTQCPLSMTVYVDDFLACCRSKQLLTTETFRKTGATMSKQFVEMGRRKWFQIL
jgi:hypothetical protein